jgi:hypothetical protein
MITKLDLVPNRQEFNWIINVYEEDASNGVNILPAV